MFRYSAIANGPVTVVNGARLPTNADTTTRILASRLPHTTCKKSSNARTMIMPTAVPRMAMTKMRALTPCPRVYMLPLALTLWLYVFPRPCYSIVSIWSMPFTAVERVCVVPCRADWI